MGRRSGNICTLSNIPAALKILNAELDVLDLKHIPGSIDDQDIIVHLINRCYELTLTSQKSNVLLNERLVESFRLQTAVNNEQKEKYRLENSLKNERRKVEDLKIKVKDLDSQLFAKGKEIKSANKEVLHLQRELTIRKLQHDHEIRRINELVDALKKKIHSFMVNPPDKLDDVTGVGCSKRTISSTNLILDSQYDEILDKYVCHLHNNIQILLDENAKYRTLLESINDKLVIHIIDIPTASLRLPEMSCQSAVQLVDNHFNIFLNRIDEKETTDEDEVKNYKH